MKKYDNAFSSAAKRISDAAKKTSDDYAGKAIPDEPAFTAALITRIQDKLSNYSKSGITWNAKMLSSHGPNTEETRFGADFLGTLKLDLPEYSIRKGFLAQAKRQEPGKALSNTEWSRLQTQCNTMLRFSSSSYIFVYALNGVYVVPAISAIACKQAEDLYTLHPKILSGFYKEHFMCFFGDKAIDSATPKVLDNLLARFTLEVSAGISDKSDLIPNENT